MTPSAGPASAATRLDRLRVRRRPVGRLHPGGRPARKLAIEVHADDKSNTERMETFSSQGATEFTLSSDEKNAILIVHGELFRVPVGHTGKAARMTQTGVSNHGVAWSPDMSKVLFLSDRDGQR